MKVLCGEWMPVAAKPCARAVGHSDSHRTRYALDNNRDRKWFGIHRRVRVRVAGAAPEGAILGPGRCDVCSQTVWYMKARNGWAPAWRNVDRTKHQCVAARRNAA